MANRILCWSLQSFLLVLVSSTLLFSQGQPQSDPQAVSLATQAMAALTNGVAVSDATLTGNVIWTSGSDNETGGAVAYVKGATESRIDLTLSGGNRSDIRNSSNASSPAGEWDDASGNANPYAFQNCWTDSGWFFPPLSSLSVAGTDPTLILVYIGLEQRSGVSVQHVQAYRYIASKRASTTTFDQQMSTADYYLNATSLLPVAITFNAHPDSDASTNIAVEIDFSNYQNVNGIQTPFHIQKIWQGNVLLDLTVTSAVFNSGLSDSLFAIQ